jgi:hypothetical protein
MANSHHRRLVGHYVRRAVWIGGQVAVVLGLVVWVILGLIVAP